MYEDKPKELKISILGMLRTIIDNPGEACTRLVLADALDELNGGGGINLDLLRADTGFWSADMVRLYAETDLFKPLRYVLYWHVYQGGCYKDYPKIAVAASSDTQYFLGASCVQLVGERAVRHEPPVYATESSCWKWLCGPCLKRLGLTPDNGVLIGQAGVPNSANESEERTVSGLSAIG